MPVRSPAIGSSPGRPLAFVRGKLPPFPRDLVNAQQSQRNIPRDLQDFCAVAVSFRRIAPLSSMCDQDEMTRLIIEIAPYRVGWPAIFRDIAGRLRDTLGERIIALHHIGSTAVPGLAAKDIVDIQLTVASLGAHPDPSIEAAGFQLGRPTRDHCPPGLTLQADQLAKRFYNYSARPANLHVREAGRFNQRYPLLCRDYLRSHPMAAEAYGAIKRRLASFFPNDPDAYYAIKDPTLDLLMVGAEDWAISAGWSEPPSD
jgi:GrpB-like predicted nucleotidyltransferase (UPF0157 family)